MRTLPDALDHISPTVLSRTWLIVWWYSVRMTFPVVVEYSWKPTSTDSLLPGCPEIFSAPQMMTDPSPLAIWSD
jgi:hypothetical protein